MIELLKRHRLAIDAQINIVPYIDVMLVLLVIFMMTTPIIEQGIEVDLPFAEAKIVDFTQQPTIITIDKQGKYFINSLNEMDSDVVVIGEKLPLGVIVGRVNARLEIYPKMKVFVRGDRQVDYGSVVSLMSILQKNGVDKVGIVTESPDVR